MLKKLAIRAITALSWKLSSERLASSLQRFSQVEADSAWQMLQALEAVDDPVFQAKLFNNALEEVHHAAIFSKLAREHSSMPLPLVVPRRSAIYHPKRGLREFEAHHFLGEAAVYDQFFSYAKATSSESLRRAFFQIRGDEEAHQALAYAEIERMSGSRWRTSRLLAGIRLRRIYEAWVRFGRKVADLWLTVVLSGIYFAVGPVFGPLCRRRLAIVDRDAHLPG